MNRKIKIKYTPILPVPKNREIRLIIFLEIWCNLVIDPLN